MSVQPVRVRLLGGFAVDGIDNRALGSRKARPGYRANLLEAWLPTLTGVEEKLEAGARVADIGCGHGITTF